MKKSQYETSAFNLPEQEFASRQEYSPRQEFDYRLDFSLRKHSGDKQQLTKKTSRNQAPSYIRGFDGMRFLGLIFVLLYHFFPSSIKGGYLGVVIFFTLSGYLVTDALINEYQTQAKINILDFYKRRIKRLYPALIFMMLCLSSWLLLFQPQVLHNYRAGFFSSLLGFNNIWQITSMSSYFDRFTSVNFFQHIWTLAIEIQFYIIWPFVIIFSGKIFSQKNLRRSLRPICIILTLLSFLLMMIITAKTTNINRVYFGTDTRAFSIILGALLASLLNNSRIRSLANIIPAKVLDIASLVIFLPMLAMLFNLKGESNFVYYGGMFFFNILLIMLLPIAVSDKTILGKICQNNLLGVFARRSYSLYLWQIPIINLSLVGLTYYDIPYSASVPVQIFFLILMGEISYQLCEKKRGFFAFDLFNKNSKLNEKGEIVSRKKFGFKTLACLSLTIVLVVMSTIALIIAPSGQPQDIIELKKQLEENSNKNKDNLNLDKEKEVDPNNTSKEGEDKKQEENISNNENQPKKEGDRTSDLGPAEWSNTKYVQELEKYLPVKFDRVQAIKDFPYAIKEFPNLALDEFAKRFVNVLPVAIVGDSVLLGAANELGQVFQNSFIDGKVSRQFAAGAEIIDQLAKDNKLPKTIILALGTNGVISAGQVNAFAEKYKDHTIFLVNTVVNNQAESIANSAISDAISRQPNTVLVDWHKLAKNKVALFASDNVHPSVNGRTVYAQMIAKAVSDYYLDIAREKINEKN